MYRILAIDDDPFCRKVCTRTLVPEGFELLLAGDVAEAMRSCVQGKPDLILLDVNLPDGNGIDLCRKIKADQKLRHIPILLITGEAMEVEHCVDGIEAGAEDYIRKPFTPKELLSRINRILKASVRPPRP